jgi:hypothetical protein
MPRRLRVCVICGTTVVLAMLLGTDLPNLRLT